MAGALSGDIDIPKVGKFPKIAIAVGVGGVVGLIIWQNHKNSQASSAAAATPAATAGGDPYPSDGTTGNPDDPYSLDPTTGVTYGDEAAAGLGTGYGGYDVGEAGTGGGYGISAVTDSYPWDGTYGNSSDPYSMDSATGQTYGNEGTVGTSPGVTTGTSGPPFSTNAQWSQYVLTYYASSSNLQGITDAIGLYLAGQTVTATQQGYINDATAIAGTPPVAGTGNYPPSINTAGSTAGGTGATKSTAPTGTPPGLTASTSGAVTTIRWGTVSGATGYELYLASPNGALYKDAKGSATNGVFDNLIDAGGAHKGYGTWNYKVRAYNAAGSGPWSKGAAFNLAAPKK